MKLVPSLSRRGAAAALAALALAAPAAAQPTDFRSPDAQDAAQAPVVDLRSPDTKDAADRSALSVLEKQVLASRGVGAPTPPAQVTVAPPRVQAPEEAFDWGSAAIGAAAVAGLALLAVGGFALAYRTRMRVAR